MDSLIVIIALVFLPRAWATDAAPGRSRGSTEVIEAIQKSWAGLAGLLFLFC